MMISKMWAYEKAVHGEGALPLQAGRLASNWQEVGTRRQANYSNLPPRNYRFRVIASNKCGVWEQTQIARDLQDTLLQICARYEEHE